MKICVITSHKVIQCLISIQKSINIIHHINGKNKKKYMIYVMEKNVKFNTHSDLKLLEN